MAGTTYDLVIIGGGVHGACIAWEAVCRGLSVALVEKADFASATSANSLKIIHGGLRYLQHANFQRMRQSIGERRTLLQIAPHLIHPLPVLMPTYGYGMQSKEAMFLALKLNDLISFDRNRLRDHQKHIPPGRVISRQECLNLVPNIDPRNLTGGAIFSDAQVYNSERLILAFLRSAAQAGAHLANYAEVVGFLRTSDQVVGVEVCDQLTGDRFSIRAKTVVNTAGPWVRRVLGLLKQQPSGVHLATAINLVTRPLFQTYAVGVSGRGKYHDSDAVIKKGSRLFFVVPWRGRSIVGTAYIAYTGDPDDFTVTEQDLEDFLRDVNEAYPAAQLTRADIDLVHGGLVPISAVDPKTGAVQLTKHFSLEDHRQEGCPGLISVVGVKYTTARHVAETVIDTVFETWGKRPPRSPSRETPIYGGQIPAFDTFVEAETQKRPYGLTAEAVRSLLYNYGSAYPAVLKYMQTYANGDRTLPEHLAVLQAETRHAVHEEMAQKLADVVFRRTELGTAGHPGDVALAFCAKVMGAALGWNDNKIAQELYEVSQQANWLAHSTNVEQEDLNPTRVLSPSVVEV